MPNKRRRGQCLDFAMGGLKKLAYDPEVKGDIRLEAIRLMLEIDQVIAPRLTGDSGQPTLIPNIVGPDPLLESLKARHAATTGETNANS